MQGYSVIRCDRVGRLGGGVCAYIREELTFTVISSSAAPLPQSGPEFLFFELSVLSKVKILLGVVYRPPKIGFTATFESALTTTCQDYGHKIMFGDWNTDLCSRHPDAEYLRRTFAGLDLHLVPYSPTHHTLTSSTWIDLGIVDDLSAVITYGQMAVPFLSNHDLIYLEYCLPVSSRLPIVRRCLRDLRRLDDELFSARLDSLDWSAVLSSVDVEDQVHKLYSILNPVFDEFVPFRTVGPKKRSVPWLTPQIRDLIRARNHIRTLLRRNRSASLLLQFRALRSKVKAELAKARSAYFSARLSGARDPRTLWHVLRTARVVPPTPSDLSSSNLSISPDDFNSYFCSNFRTSSGDASLLLESVHFDDEQFHFADISPLVLLENLFFRLSSVAGSDGISGRILRQCVETLFPVILNIFNNSLQSGNFPAIWKKALVTPVPKISAPSGTSDFRPVSILCDLSKILER
ncbi:hypothetical protein KPH14_012913, partial [Odynerus spinipes]